MSARCASRRGGRMSFEWANLTVLAGIWALLALPTLAVLLAGWDPVGRVGGTGLGRRVDSRWGWFVMEFPALVIFPAIYLLSGSLHLIGNIVLVLWLAHYAHRTFVWPWRVPQRGATLSITMCAAAAGFNLVNGGLLGWFMGYSANYPDHWPTDPRFVSGAVLLIGGAALNIWADYRLLHLREAGKRQRVLPHGGAFDFVCCPNLSGEIIQWAGFALLTWSLPGLAFAVWTVANLLPRAVWRRNWYREHFSDYPKERAALFPGVI